jgi:hypothetical protein
MVRGALPFRHDRLHTLCRELGDTFKWVLYGDDDTLFFLEAAMKVVEGLDPDMPYWLADNQWGSDLMGGGMRHPHRGAPVCVPCGYAGDTSQLAFPAPPACTCTPAALCAADTTGWLNKPPAACGFPRCGVMRVYMYHHVGTPCMRTPCTSMHKKDNTLSQ